MQPCSAPPPVGSAARRLARRRSRALRTRCSSPPRAAVGDIHGDLQKALACLEMAGVLAEDDGHIKWVGGDTTVVQLGDVLDRGDCEIGASRELWSARGLWMRLASPCLAAQGAGLLGSRACTAAPPHPLTRGTRSPLRAQARCCCCASWTGRRGRRAAPCTCSMATTRALT